MKMACFDLLHGMDCLVFVPDVCGIGFFGPFSMEEKKNDELSVGFAKKSAYIPAIYCGYCSRLSFHGR